MPDNLKRYGNIHHSSGPRKPPDASQHLGDYWDFGEELPLCHRHAVLEKELCLSFWVHLRGPDFLLPLGRGPEKSGQAVGGAAFLP